MIAYPKTTTPDNWTPPHSSVWGSPIIWGSRIYSTTSVFPYILVDEISLVQPRVMFGFGGFILTLYILVSNIRIFSGLFKLFLTIFVLINLCAISVCALTYSKSVYLEKEFYNRIHHNISYQDKHSLTSTIMVCGRNSYIHDSPYIARNRMAFPLVEHVVRDRSVWVNGLNGFFKINNIPFVAIKCDSMKPYSDKTIVSEKEYQIYKIADNSYQLLFRTES